MESDSLPTELILNGSRQPLGQVYLDHKPQPGAYLDYEGQTYAVLERRHRYQLKANKYRLHKVALYVQTAQIPAERSFVEGRWVVGDAACVYNARSEILRCAVKPEGPCEGCRFYEGKSKEG